MEHREKKFKKRFLSEVGKTAGPTMTNGQTTFSYVFGLFDEQNNQITHRMANGEEKAIVFVSYPIPTDDEPTKSDSGKILLH